MKECPHCGSQHLVIESAPAPHYQKLVCGECERWLRWLSHPQKQLQDQIRVRTIEQLLKSSILSDWEWGFLISIKSQKSLSQKQQQVYQRIFPPM